MILYPFGYKIKRFGNNLKNHRKGIPDYEKDKRNVID
jgi:hypothetical protein